MNKRIKIGIEYKNKIKNRHGKIIVDHYYAYW